LPAPTVWTTRQVLELRPRVALASPTRHVLDNGATFASHTNLGGAGVVRALFARVTGINALVLAIEPTCAADLLTRRTVARMARFSACVIASFQSTAARVSATARGHVARKRRQVPMATDTQLHCEFSAQRMVAIVAERVARMAAVHFATARPGAVGRLGAASHRRLDDLFSASARERRASHHAAWTAVSQMAKVLTSVFAALQGLAAHDRAEMHLVISLIPVRATDLFAPVPQATFSCPAASVANVNTTGLGRSSEAIHTAFALIASATLLDLDCARRATVLVTQRGALVATA